MALFHCDSCGLKKVVPDKHLGRKVKCPKCGPDQVVEIVPEPDADPAAEPSLPETPAPETVASQATAPEHVATEDALRDAHAGAEGEDGEPAAPGAPGVPADEGMAHFHCRNCGYTVQLPGRFVGKTAPCPKCHTPVLADKALDVPPTEEDIDTEALAQATGATRDFTDTDDDFEAITGGEAAPAQPGAQPSVQSEGISLAEADASQDNVKVFQGSLPLNLFAGLTAGVSSFFFCLASATLLFLGSPMSSFFGHGLSVFLGGAVIVGVLYALRSRVPFAVSAPDASVTAVLFLMIHSLYAEVQAAGLHPFTHLPTIAAAIAVSAAAMGLALLFTANRHAGVWLRFIPYPVVGGIMAGLGLILLRGVYTILVGNPLDLAELAKVGRVFRLFGMQNIQDVLSLGIDLSSIPAFAFGLLLFLVLRRRSNIFTLLFLLVAGCALGQLPAFVPGLPIPRTLLSGLTLSPFSLDKAWEAYNLDFLSAIQWRFIADHAAYIVTMAGIVIATTMLKTTSLEVVLGHEVDLDRELSALGGANLLAGLVGGAPGAISMSRSMSLRMAGGSGPIAGMCGGLACLAALFWGEVALPYIPLFVPCGMIVYLGLALMAKWLWSSKAELTRIDDYVLLLMVFLAICVFGLMPGVAIGIALGLMVMISRYGRVPVVKHMLSGANHRSNVDRSPRKLGVLKEKGGQIFILRLQGFMFLGTTHSLMKQIRARLASTEEQPVRYIILDFTLVSGLDSTVAISFTKLKQLARSQGITLLFTNVLFEVEQELERAGYALDDPDGSSRAFVNLDYAMEWCEDHILDAEHALATDTRSLPELLAPIFPDPAVIPRLMQWLVRVEVPSGKPVFRQGDASDAMYFIESGTVNVELSLGGNKILRLKKMGAGTVFGEMGIYTTAPRSAGIVADEDCVLYRLSTDRLEAIQAKDPLLVSAIHRFVVNLLADRVFDANTKVRDLQN